MNRIDILRYTNRLYYYYYLSITIFSNAWIDSNYFGVRAGKAEPETELFGGEQYYIFIHFVHCHLQTLNMHCNCSKQLFEKNNVLLDYYAHKVNVRTWELMISIISNVISHEFNCALSYYILFGWFYLMVMLW